MVFSTSAIVLGMLMLRAIEALPDVRPVRYIIPTQTAAFAFALAIILFGRLSYNRYLLPTSFALSVLWFFAIQVLAASRSAPHFHVVPFGNVQALFSIDNVRWTMLEQPDLTQIESDGIIVDLRADLDRDWERFITDCAIRGVRVFHVKQISERLTGRVEIEHLSENTLGSINPQSAYGQIKHFFDWVFALVAGILLLPMFAVIAIAIKIDSPGPVFFLQSRVGYGGRPFTCFKFRTMANRSAGEMSRDKAMTRSDDPRITRVGRFLRRTRLDELPQLLNVLRGEMSWIGPRPEAQELSKWYEEELPFYRYRHVVRPGISGWAQVNQGHVVEVDQVMAKLHYDFYYIKNYSLWLDILIFFRTIFAVFTGFGAK